MMYNNYKYDQIGNLIKDDQEVIADMKWRPDGKLEFVTRSVSSGKLNLKFDYDVSGNRIAKHVIDNSDNLLNTTYYVRDAQGNVMSVYKLDIDTTLSSLSYAQKERHIYGSSMLGMDTDSLEMIGASVADSTLFSYMVGNKRFSLHNHINDVVAVITDKKLPVDENTNGFVNYYKPEIKQATDRYPGGWRMYERNFIFDKKFRYGAGGHEVLDELLNDGYVDMGERLYDSRILRIPTLDPKMKQNASWSPYAYALNNPVMFIDKEGEWPGVLFMFFELDLGGGLAYGLNYIEQSGVAFDKAGTTHFVVSHKMHVTNQSLEKYSKNPSWVGGISVNLQIGGTLDWKSDNFLEHVGSNKNQISGFDFGVGEVGFGEGIVTLKGGIGYGLKMSVLATQVNESISLTRAEASKVGKSTDVFTESWRVNNKQYDAESGQWTGTVSTKNTKGEVDDTGIKIFSSNVLDSQGENASSNVWSSESYQNEANNSKKD